MNEMPYPSIVVALYHFEEIDSKNFEYETEVISVRPFEDERIQELHGVGVVSSETSASFLQFLLICNTSL